MNLNTCKEYHFSHGFFISTDSQERYPFIIPVDDRFYIYMKDHIANEYVTGQTKEIIDKIIITDSSKSFFSERNFTLKAIILITDLNNVVTAYDFQINNVSLHETQFSSTSYNTDSWELSLYELQIPYKTQFSINICE